MIHWVILLVRFVEVERRFLAQNDIQKKKKSTNFRLNELVKLADKQRGKVVAGRRLW